MSVYSVVCAVLFYNAALAVVYFLLKRVGFVERYTVSVLSFLTLLAILRVIIPADLTDAVIIKSDYILPRLRVFLSAALPFTGLSPGTLLLLIWLAGTAWYICRDLKLLVSAKRLECGYRPVSNECIERQLAAMNIGYTVIISPDISEPYSAGIFRPKIFLPDWQLDERDMQTVLRHELQHLRSHDSLRKLFFLLMEAVFWWNPLAHSFRRHFDLLLEIECDYRVLRGKSDKERADYADTMIVVMRKVLEGRTPLGCAALFVNKKSDMLRRVELILSAEKPKSPAKRLLVKLAMLLCFLLSYFVIIQPHYEPNLPEMEGVEYFKINCDTSFILYSGNNYYLYSDNTFVGEVSESELEDEPCKSLPVIEAAAEQQ